MKTQFFLRVGLFFAITLPVMAGQNCGTFSNGMVLNPPAPAPGQWSIDCDFSNVNFSGLILDQVVFSNCDLSNANFSGAYLIAAAFPNSNLSNANLTSAQLNEANFAQANLSGTNFSGSSLRMASFYQADNFSGAIFFDKASGGATLQYAVWIDGTTCTNWQPNGLCH